MLEINNPPKGQLHSKKVSYTFLFIPSLKCVFVHVSIVHNEVIYVKRLLMSAVKRKGLSCGLNILSLWALGGGMGDICKQAFIGWEFGAPSIFQDNQKLLFSPF